MKEKFDHDSQDPWVLFLVTPDERNVIDQKIIEYELQVKYGLKCMRCTFQEIKDEGNIDKDTHILRVRGEEIGFVYYRSGYQIE